MILELGRQGQEECCDFEASLGLQSETPSQANTQKQRLGMWFSGRAHWRPSIRAPAGPERTKPRRNVTWNLCLLISSAQPEAPGMSCHCNPPMTPPGKACYRSAAGALTEFRERLHAQPPSHRLAQNEIAPSSLMAVSSLRLDNLPSGPLSCCGIILCNLLTAVSAS